MSADAHGPTGDHPRARRVITPLNPPMVPLAVGGIAAWVLAGLVLLGLRPTLIEHGREDWLWICVAGFLWGFPGLYVMVRHDANRRRRAAARRDA